MERGDGCFLHQIMGIVNLAPSLAICMSPGSHQIDPDPAIPVLLLAVFHSHSWQNSGDAEPSALLKEPVRSTSGALLIPYHHGLVRRMLVALRDPFGGLRDTQLARGAAPGDTPALG